MTGGLIAQPHALDEPSVPWHLNLDEPHWRSRGPERYPGQAVSFVLETLTEADEDRLLRLATLHVSVPAQWRPEFVATDAKIAEAATLLAADLGRPDALVVIALDHRRAIAGLHWVALHGLDPITAYVNTLWVEPNQRRQGIGTALKDTGEAWARNRRATRIISTVAIANPSMIAFNKARGFAVDSVDMVKSLSTS